jgi:protein involved in ribonucleotide reduction
MVNEMSWHQFSTLPVMNKVAQHEVERQYRIYLNEIAEQRIAIHLIQEAARSQAEAMAVAASNGGGGGVIQQEEGDLPSGCIEFVNNTKNGTFSEINITTSGPTSFTITWGDGTEDTDDVNGSITIDHDYADENAEYTARLCFGDISLVTELDFTGDD